MIDKGKIYITKYGIQNRLYWGKFASQQSVKESISPLILTSSHREEVWKMVF